MKSKLELENEDWDPPLDPLTEASLLPEVHKQSLFFRVASRREDYFSDVEAISQIYDIEDVPTPPACGPLRTISDTPTQPDMTPVEKQPTCPVPLTNRSTLILPSTVPPPAPILLAARFCSLYLLELLGKVRLMLRSLQNTRKLPAAFSDC